MHHTKKVKVQRKQCNWTDTATMMHAWLLSCKPPTPLNGAYCNALLLVHSSVGQKRNHDSSVQLRRSVCCFAFSHSARFKSMSTSMPLKILSIKNFLFPIRHLRKSILGKLSKRSSSFLLPTISETSNFPSWHLQPSVPSTKMSSIVFLANLNYMPVWNGNSL